MKEKIMISYYGRFGKLLGQASAVPVGAPLTTASAPVVVSPNPVVVTEPYTYDEKVSFTKAGLVVGALVLAALTLSLASSLGRRG